MNILLYRGENFNSNFYYYSGCDIDHSFYVQLKEREFLLTPKMNEAQARREFTGATITYSKWSDVRNFLSGKNFGIDGSSISYKLHSRLRSSCKLSDIGKKLLEKRTVKTAEEIGKIKKAAKISREIFDSIEFSKCKTELDVKKQLLAASLEENAEPAFEPIVASDRNAALPHYRPGNIKLGSMVLIDYAVKFDYYCADMTRCFFLKRDRKKEEAYEKVKSVFYELIGELPSLETGGELAKLSDELFGKHKLPKPIHSIGHGIGLDVHELPSLRLKSKDKLKNSVLAIEPAAYFKDFGVRFEETIYFDGKRGRIL